MMNLTETILYSCGISLFSFFGIQKVEAKRPNILFIMTDQQRYDMLSCAGNRYVHTPSLDQLAENGVRFERNYCANPVSMPSRFAMITGRFAGEIGYTNNSTKPDTLRVLPVVREVRLEIFFGMLVMKLFIPVIRVFIVEERILRIMVLSKTVRIIMTVLLTLPRVFLRVISRKKISLFFFTFHL